MGTYLMWPLPSSANSDLESSVEPAPPFAQTATKSRVFVPISVKIEELQTVLNMKVESGWKGSKADPTDALKNDRLTWDVKRGAITLSSSGGRLGFSMSTTGIVRVSGRLDLGFVTKSGSQSAQLGATASGSFGPTLNPNWTLVPNERISVTVTDANLKLIKVIEVSIRSAIQPEANKALAKEVAKAKRRLEDPSLLRRPVEEEWAKLCTVFPIEGDIEGLWLEVIPHSILAAQPKITATHVELALGIEAQTRILAQTEKPTIKSCPSLPPTLTIADPSADGLFVVELPALAELSWVEKTLSSALADKDIEIDGIGSVSLSDLTIQPDGPHLRIGAKMIGRSSGLPASVIDHQIWLRGRPQLDHSEKKILIDDLDFDVETKTWFGQSAEWLLKRAVINRIKERAVIEYGKKEAELTNKIRTAIGHFSQSEAGGASIKIALASMDLADVEVGENGLHFLVIAKGTARLENVVLTQGAF